MAVESMSNLSNLPFVLSGELFNKDALTIKQDAGRVTALALYTVMGLEISAVPTTGTAVVGNTGNGTVTAVVKVQDGQAAIVGNYVLECTAAVANGGVFKLTDPFGNILATGLTMTPGTGAATIFQEGGLRFTITDGATDFAVADKFNITVTAVNKLVPLNGANVNGGQKFAGILENNGITAAQMVAGDITSGKLIIGGRGVVDSAQLVWENGLSLGTVLPSGKTVEQEMRDLGIFVAAPVNINEFENV